MLKFLCFRPSHKQKSGFLADRKFMDTPQLAEGNPAQTLDLETLSSEEIATLTAKAFADTDPNAEPPEETEDQSQQTETEEVASEQETETDSEEQPEPQEGEKQRGRFRLEGNDAKYARLLKESVPRADAYRLAYGEDAPQKPVTESTTDTTETQETLSPVELLDQQLDDLIEQKQAADDAYGESYDPDDKTKSKELEKKINKLIRSRQDTVAELSKVSAIQEFQKAQQQTSQATAQQAALDEAVSLYPELGEEGSPMQIYAQALEERLIKAGDKRVGSPALVLEIAQQAAKAFNREPANGQTNPPRNIAPTPSGRTPTAKPAAMPTRANPPAAPITAKDLDQMSPEEVEVLYRQHLKGRK